MSEARQAFSERTSRPWATIMVAAAAGLGMFLAALDIALNVALEQLQLQDIAGWDSAISIEINYHLENHPFNCDLLLLFPDQAVDDIRMILDSMINI